MKHHHIIPALAIGTGVAIGIGVVACLGGAVLLGAVIERRRMRKRYPCWMLDDEEFDDLFDDEWVDLDDAAPGDEAEQPA